MENVSSNSSEHYDTRMALLKSWVGYVEISYLSIMIIIGVPGNTLILLVQNRNRTKSSTDILIAAMAGYELVCSSFNAAFKILINTELWKSRLRSDTLCRIHISSVFITTFTSAYLLAAIAVDRYVKTCRPLSNSFNLKTSKIICVVVFVLGFITGTVPLVTFVCDDQFECSPSLEHLKLQFFWDLVMMSSTVIVFAVFTFSYLNIAVTLRKKIRVTSEGTKNSQEVNGIKINRSALTKVLKKFSSFKVEPLSRKLGSGSFDQPVSQGASSSQGMEERDSVSTTEMSKKTAILRVHRPATLAGESVNKTTLMLFLLTVLYVVSFSITNIFVMTADAIIGRIMEKLCKSFPMINCISNPIFFFCLSTKYRQAAKAIICRDKRKH